MHGFIQWGSEASPPKHPASPPPPQKKKEMEGEGEGEGEGGGAHIHHQCSLAHRKTCNTLGNGGRNIHGEIAMPPNQKTHRCTKKKVHTVSIGHQ